MIFASPKKWLCILIAFRFLLMYLKSMFVKHSFSGYQRQKASFIQFSQNFVWSHSKVSSFWSNVVHFQYYSIMKSSTDLMGNILNNFDKKLEDSATEIFVWCTCSNMFFINMFIYICIWISTCIFHTHIHWQGNYIYT